ncbi:NAD(P)H-dependent oxidoreductase subunit E [Trichormus azollae]|uniref:NAD(P)H-dependent oxidoreductase subunit E n=1 Tax=Trichormus azollae TaxID=1164 RepID=UPI00325E6C16
MKIIHRASELFGYLELNLLLYITHQLKLLPSRVYRIVTFYNLFSLAPKGKHNCVVYRGTACYVKGCQAILSSLENVTRIRAGETTSNGEISLMTTRCLGACGITHLGVFDGAAVGN